MLAIAFSDRVAGNDGSRSLPGQASRISFARDPIPFRVAGPGVSR
jgi:hypothetical protein